MPTDSGDRHFRRWVVYNERGKLSDYAWHLRPIFDINKVTCPIIPRFNVNRSTVSRLNIRETKLSKDLWSYFLLNFPSPSHSSFRVRTANRTSFD